MVPLLKSIFKIGKKLFIAIAIYLIVTGAFLMLMNPKQYAINSEEVQKQQMAPIYTALNEPKNNTTKERRAYNQLYKYVVCHAVGELCTSQPTANSQKYFNDSVMGNISHLLATPYMNPPASGTAWTYTALQHVGIVPKTYAAEGIGLAGIQPLSKIWLLFRNATYLLLTLLIVSIGLLIMFRFKINPQTVVTLENSLPRIIITLILITFSFAIAGFMIDFMYMIILMAISVFASLDPEHFNAAQLNRQYVTAGLGTLWDGFFPRAGRASVNSLGILGEFRDLVNLGNALIDVLPTVISASLRTMGTMAFAYMAYQVVLGPQAGLGKPLTESLDNNSFLGFGVGTLPHSLFYYIILGLIMAILIPFGFTFLGGFILALILFLTLIGLFFRIMVLLFATYLRIVLYVIFAPFMILTTAIPGRNGFIGWIRSLAGELSVFPTVIILLLVGRMLVTVYSTTRGGFNVGGGAGLWTPPFLWGIGSRSLAIIIAMQMIFLIPDLARLVKTKISGKQALPFKTGMGVFFGGVTSPATAGLAGVTQVTGLKTLFYGPGTGILGQGATPAATFSSMKNKVGALFGRTRGGGGGQT